MAGFGKGGAELQAKECRQPLEVEKPSKEKGPQSYRRQEPDSASDPVERKMDSPLRFPRKITDSPAGPLISAS